jgi:hypothetical protein
MKVYPNPTNGVLTIELTGENRFQAARVEMYNMSGSLVISKELNGDRIYTLSVSTLPSGIYFLHVNSGSDSESVKVIKL